MARNPLEASLGHTHTYLADEEYILCVIPQQAHAALIDLVLVRLEFHRREVGTCLDGGGVPV